MSEKQTVLIVDDIKENIDILVEILKKNDLVTALDGKTALEIVAQEDVDLILLDIMMPEMDGFEVCKILKQNTETSHIPIIFLTAKDKSDNIQNGFRMGAVDYITKPFNPNELLSRVDTHLKLRAYEKDLEKRVEQELEKNKKKQQLIYQQSKQAALGELLMNIAHQWKQPLSSLSSVNILNRTNIEQNIPISITNIEKSEYLVNFMSNTIDTFKNFYQPSYVDEEFSLTDSVNKVLIISDASLNHYNINISLVSHETKETFANANEFTQVIFSIINNARDIFELRKISNPKLKIEIENHKISISDNAGGVDKEIIDDIFLPFKSTTNGNGIGLYIAKGIVEKNGGVISVHNNEIGAVFNIEFLTWLD